MEKIRVLVTGAGSIVGQGIMKSLRISSLPVIIVAADIHPLNAGLYRADEAVIVPKVEEDGSLEKIMNALKEKHIQVVMVGSEFDLMFFAEYKQEIEKETGALVVVSPLETVRIADDKWLTAEFLREHGLPCAPSYLPKSAEDAIVKANEWGYPVILKPRSGTSSRGLHILHNEGELARLFPTVSNPLLQKCIAMPKAELGSEYTCSIFRCKDGKLFGPFTARRVLRSGSSWIVEVVELPGLHVLMRQIGAMLSSLGSLNVQLMIGKDGPVPFEFNARFSGTTSVRAHFGFNEPEMVLRNYYLGETITAPAIRKGLAISYKEDVFIDGVNAQELKEPFPKGNIQSWF